MSVITESIRCLSHAKGILRYNLYCKLLSQIATTYNDKLILTYQPSSFNVVHYLRIYVVRFYTYKVLYIIV